MDLRLDNINPRMPYLRFASRLIEDALLMYINRAPRLFMTASCELLKKYNTFNRTHLSGVHLQQGRTESEILHVKQL